MMALALIKRYTINPLTLIFSPEIEYPTSNEITKNKNLKTHTHTQENEMFDQRNQNKQRYSKLKI